MSGGVPPINNYKPPKASISTVLNPNKVKSSWNLKPLFTLYNSVGHYIRWQTGQFQPCWFKKKKKKSQNLQQLFVSETGKNKLQFNNYLRLRWCRSSQWAKWLTDICFKPAGKVVSAQLITLTQSHTFTCSLLTQILTARLETQTHIFWLVPEGSTDHILGALFSCGSFYILGLGPAVKNQVQCISLFSLCSPAVRF